MLSILDADVSFFDVVGKRVAVANACSDIKQECDEETLSCYEDGVFRYIEDNILK